MQAGCRPQNVWLSACFSGPFAVTASAFRLAPLRAARPGKDKHSITRRGDFMRAAPLANRAAEW